MARFDESQDVSVAVTASEGAVKIASASGMVRRIQVLGTNAKTVTVRCYADALKADKKVEVAFTLDATKQESEWLAGACLDGCWVTVQGGDSHTLTHLSVLFEDMGRGAQITDDLG